MAICRRRRRRRLTRMEGGRAAVAGPHARTLARTHTHSTHSTLAALTRRSSVRDPSLCLRLRLCPLPSSLRRVPAGSSFPSRPEARGGDGESCSLARSPTPLSSPLCRSLDVGAPEPGRTNGRSDVPPCSAACRGRATLRFPGFPFMMASGKIKAIFFVDFL